MPKELEQSLINELFKASSPCGKEHKFVQHFPKIREGFSNHHTAPHIVPDRFIRPKIFVTVDFTHQFVMNLKDAEIESKKTCNSRSS
jgi:hypothetical protein